MVAKGHNYGLCLKCGKIHIPPTLGNHFTKTPEECLHHSLVTKGKKRTQKCKDKMSRSAKGRVLSEEHKNNISKSKRGKKVPKLCIPKTPEWKRHISEAKLGSIPWNKGLTKDDPRVLKHALSITGVSKSEETKRNMSKAKMLQSPELLTKIGKIGNQKMLSHTTSEIRIDKAIHAMQSVKKSGTDIEILLENILKSLNISYEPQKIIKYICKPDFFVKPNICIFADGDYHHKLPDVIIRDRKINQKLKENKYIILRFWGIDIKKHSEMIYEEIYKIIPVEI
jgi:very-short-patch-repair endonuclease